MVQNNKVLTVSYGTFSCTLEGFDDSFETMKSIAEYFRDLAAEDRYFGSEPPQPDAEMLTRIARRDATQQVEAEQRDTGLLLRATPAASSAPAMVEAERSEQDTAAFFAQPEAEAVSPAPAADSITAKLQRIRAVVSHSDITPSAYTEDEDASLLNGGAPVDAVAAAFEAGALNAEDLEPQLPATPAETAMIPTPQESELPAEFEEDGQTDTELFGDLEDTTEDEAADDKVADILQKDEVEQASPEQPQDNAEPDRLTAEDEAQILQKISHIETGMSDRAGSKLAEETNLDEDMSRLMDKAGAQMEDPSTSDARETYSHLRTAVAAAEAEDQADRPSKDEDYRGDLASVVSPRRPEIQVTSMRPVSDTAAPLKLVAEQRVDDQPVDTGPVTPRRVTSEQESETEESGFAQFAQEQGAQSLSDLLEAAAAYLSFIEGQARFSRPQLMNKVRSLQQDEFNREESLRSFGQLLRDGKIEKAGGGRFAASQLIGFRPDDERAAG